MECNGHGLLEEILALRSESWEANIPLEMNNEFYTNGWSNFDNSLSTPQTSYFEEFSLPLFDHQSLNCSFATNDLYHQFPEVTDSSTNKLETPPFPHPSTQEESYSLMSLVDDEDVCFLVGNLQNGISNMDHHYQVQAPCKIEPQQPIFNMGTSVCLEKKSKIKKLDGQPSKNLMAERRRRKRLNDRLSMLRSVVPKISKMDRTSILGDTIDYMKELLERITCMQEEIEVGNSNQLTLMNIFKDVKPNEILVRNSPKFDVERRNMDTRIEICCAGKPGLLLSTVSTLEALGLEIQQCVISCFNDFSMQASCSEELEQRGIFISAEEIKQELFKNAGYGGRCL